VSLGEKENRGKGEDRKVRENTSREKLKGIRGSISKGGIGV